MIVKKKEFNKKLTLGKKVIANLTNQEKANVYGGINTTTPGDGATCAGSCIDQCLPTPSDDCWSQNPCTSAWCPSIGVC